MQLAIGEFGKGLSSERHALLKGPKCNFVRNFYIFFRFQNKVGTEDEQNKVSNNCVFCKTLHGESGVNVFLPVLSTFLNRSE
jgi:hypothetical protein